MKRLFAIVVVALLAGIIFPCEALAANYKNAKITRIGISSVSAPTFNTSKHPATTASNWCLIDVEYSLDGERGNWIDDLEIRWFVAIKTDNGNKILTLFRNVKYCDIEANKKHVASVLIGPRFFERYTAYKRADAAKVSAYVEVYVGGKLVVRKERKSNSISVDNWWTNMDKPSKRLENALLPRYMTPFYFVDSHYYDAEVQEPASKSGTGK